MIDPRPKHISSFSRHYLVTYHGQVTVCPDANPNTPTPELYLSREGLPAVILYRMLNNGKKRKVRMLVKEAVAKAFVENQFPLKLRGVRTKDGNEQNLSADNLEWYDTRARSIDSRVKRTASTALPSPTGWHKGSRTLPDGRAFKRHALSFPVSCYKAVPSGKSVKAGALIRIYPSLSAAAKGTNASLGGIRHCCDYWYLQDGMGYTYVDIKGYGRATCPEELPFCSKVACSPTKQYVFKWSGVKDARLHPVGVVVDDATHLFYPSLADAARALHSPYETPEELAALMSGVAAASPMYDSPDSMDTNKWPMVLTTRGRVNIYYV